MEDYICFTVRHTSKFVRFTPFSPGCLHIECGLDCQISKVPPLSCIKIDSYTLQWTVGCYVDSLHSVTRYRNRARIWWAHDRWWYSYSLVGSALTGPPSVKQRASSTVLLCHLRKMVCEIVVKAQCSFLSRELKEDKTYIREPVWWWYERWGRGTLFLMLWKIQALKELSLSDFGKLRTHSRSFCAYQLRIVIFGATALD